MSNLLKDASILLTPTGYDNGKMLSIKPEDGDGDFTFSRNSAATRVNAQGLVENVQILSSDLVQNGSFSQIGPEEVTNGSFTNGSTDWTLENGWSIGDDKAISDGSGSIPNTDLVQGNVFTTGKSYKVTLEIKDYVSGNLQLQNNTTNFPQSNGIHTIYSSEGSTSLILRSLSFIGSITNISVKEVGQNWILGTGWSIGDNEVVYNTSSNETLSQVGTYESGKTYKLTLELKSHSRGLARVSINGGDLVNVPTSAGIHTMYLVAGTSAYKAFRFYGGGFGNGGEGSITNIVLLEITNDTDLPRINYEGFSYDGNGDIIPDSGCGSWLLEPQSTNIYLNSETLSTQDNTTLASTYTVSFYGTGTITFSGTHTGSLVGTSLTDRVSATFTATAGTLTSTVSGTVTKGQLENLNFASSYIPTSGASSTRLQDLASGSGNSTLINSTEGVLYAEIKANAIYNLQRWLSLSDGSHNNTVKIGFLNHPSDYKIACEVKSGGVSQAFMAKDFGAVALEYVKVAIKYKENDFALWVNGVEVDTDTSGSAPIGLNNLRFTRGDSVQKFFGKVKAVAVYKEALTDAELTCLTTI